MFISDSKRTGYICRFSFVGLYTHAFIPEHFREERERERERELERERERESKRERELERERERKRE